MSRLAHLSRDERGVTLIELLVGVTIGVVVLGAVMVVMEVGARSAGRTSDRADTTQRARTAMNAITRKLRSMVCVNSETPPIASGNDTLLMYWTDTDADPYFVPEGHWIFFDSAWKGGRGAIREFVWKPDQTSSQGPPWTYSGGAKERVLLEDVTTVGSTPFFRYYGFQNPSTILTTPLDTSLTADPLPANSIAKVVRVDVSFRALPSRRSSDSGPISGNQLDTARDADLDTSVYARNSDYTDTGQANRTWGPRCS